MVPMDYPCKDCAERYRACHDTCEKYLKVKRERELRKALQKADKEPVGYIVDSIRDNRDKHARRRREVAGTYKWSK